MTLGDEEIRAAIAVQAGEWFLANQAGPLEDEESAAFLAWLKASPVHVREYLGVARIAHDLRAVVGTPQVPLETFLEQARAGDGLMTVSSLGFRRRMARRMVNRGSNGCPTAPCSASIRTQRLRCATRAVSA